MLRGPIRFTNALAGTVDFIYPGPTIDMQSPASAGAVNGSTYVYYAQSLDMSEWEIGSGAYNSATKTFARTTITANHLGTTAKISFTHAPQVLVLDTALGGEADSGPVGQCKFVYVDSTHCKLIPFNGNKIKINGALYSIPAAGVTITGPFTANTLWYIYAYLNAGVLTLTAQTTAHVTSTTAGNVGIEIMSGNDGYSLVGMVRVDGAGLFYDDNNDRWTRSWFNDTGVRILASSGSAFTAPVGTWTEDTSMRAFGLFWKDEQIEITGFTTAQNNTLGGINYAVAYQNGTTTLGFYAWGMTAVANYWVNVPVVASLGVTSDQSMILSLAGQCGAGACGWGNRSMTVLSQRK